MITSNPVLLSLITIALLSACGVANKSENQEAGGDKQGPKLICSAGVSQLENTEAGIVGGELLGENTWLAKGVVLIVQEFTEPNGQKKSVSCTGSLIDTNIVLTAAHCADRILSIDDLRIYFTNQPECDSQNGKLEQMGRKVDAVKIHPAWISEGDKGHGIKRRQVRGDLAMIRLVGKAPGDWKPLALTKEFLPLSRSENILLTGYGMTNVNLESFKYSADNSEGTLLRVTQAHPLSSDAQVTDEMLFVDQSHGKGVCAGDSGSPSLAQNAVRKFVVTGVASYVSNPRNEQALCGYASAYTNVIFHKEWIQKTFTELNAGASKKKVLFN